jgi:small subunit ribosomal protein S2
MNQSFMNEAWVGGSLTNWKQVSHSILGVQRLKTHFHELVQTHSLPKYEHARKKFEGIRPGEFPDLLILTARNLSEHALLLREAKTYKIPVLCIGDDKFSRANTHEPIEYFLPGNTESVEFLYTYLNLVVICWTR